MSSDEARAEAEWRFPVTAYECPEDQSTEVERFVAGAEWQAERDGERVAKLEAERDAWIVQADGAGKGVVKLEAEVEHLRAYAGLQDELIHSLRVRAETAGAEVEQWRESDATLMGLLGTWKPRAQAAEAKITAIWHVYKDWMRATTDECSEDAEMILVDIRAALDGGDET